MFRIRTVFMPHRERAMRLRFGNCVLDSELHELTCEGRPVALSPKAFRVLEVLAERRPRVVAHSDLRGLVWPDTTAGGTTLARLVNEVRGAIGDPVRSPARPARSRRQDRTRRPAVRFSGDSVRFPSPPGRTSSGVRPRP
ncbi:MAG: hypothetical protein DMF79_12200 [Acidobacteria bacterium]|nr:MAG: hypothetical protein DMF79_12200 [Acidobacteriota bacterium]